jgi:hypothetical protein
MRAPAVLLMLLLFGCRDETQDDFNRAWTQFIPEHVSCAGNPKC